jgi:hypothetical protein
MSMKNSSDTIGNGTRDLPACGVVPQPTCEQTRKEKSKWEGLGLLLEYKEDGLEFYVSGCITLV